MTQPLACLAIAAPPPQAEGALVATLRHLFPSLDPAMLAPFFETGDTLYLSSADRPALGHVAHALRSAGHPVDPCEPPGDLHVERSLVMPHPEAGRDPDRRTIVTLGRRPLAVSKPVAITVPFPDAASGHAPGTPRCPSCRDALLPGIPFCPACGYEPPPVPAKPLAFDIRLPDDQRRQRVLAWLAQATGRTIPQLRPATGHHLQVQATLPPETATELVRRLAGWGAVVTVDDSGGTPTAVRWGPVDTGVGVAVALTATLTTLPHTLGLAYWVVAVGGWALTHRADWQRWRAGGLPRLDADLAGQLAGPMPADLLADVRACLAETAGSGLQPAVRRTLSVAAGIFGAIGAGDAVSQHLWQDLEPQLRAVVSGLLGLVRRGRQVEQFLHDHPAAGVEHEVRRLKRLLERTTDDVTRRHYELALTAARKTRQRHHDAIVAAERLGSQLLVLLHGLDDVQATVALSGLTSSGPSPLIAQVQRLQQDVQAADEALQELLG